MSDMLEKRSANHITNDAAYSKGIYMHKTGEFYLQRANLQLKVYQSDEVLGSNKKQNITKESDFDWLAHNPAWTDTLKQYRECNTDRTRIYHNIGIIGSLFAKDNMPKDAVKKLHYHHLYHHPPMVFREYCSDSSGGGGA